MATVYVAKTGNDSNAGTDPAAPKLTLQSASDAVDGTSAPRIITILDSGTYNEALHVNVGGGYGVDITIQADTGQTPIIDGNGVTGAGGIRNGPLNDGSSSPSTTTIIGIRFKRWGSAANYGVFRADYGTGDDKIYKATDCVFEDNGLIIRNPGGTSTNPTEFNRCKVINPDGPVIDPNYDGDNAAYVNFFSCVLTGKEDNHIINFAGGSHSNKVVQNCSVVFNADNDSVAIRANTVDNCIVQNLTSTSGGGTTVGIQADTSRSNNCTFGNFGTEQTGGTDGGNNLTGQDPLFADTTVTDPDLTLQTGSPCIGAGKNLSTVTTDANNVARNYSFLSRGLLTQATYDIGAFAVVASSDRLRSGLISDPERIMIASRDSATGSYPTIARTGDPDFTGKYSSKFDDTQTIVFSGSTDVIYPMVLPTGNLQLKNDVSIPSYFNFNNRAIQAQGTVRKGVSDAHLRFTPGENISPFDESRIYLDNDSHFYATGTASGTLPGFEQRLSSKTQICMKFKSLHHHEIYFSTGSDALSGSSGISYYNFEGSVWERHSGSANVDIISGDFQKGYLGFGTKSPVSYTGADDEDPRGVGYPISNFGFPYDARYEPTGSQLLSMTGTLTHPFLVEKIVLDFSASFAATTINTSTAPLTTQFFMLRQGLTGSIGTQRQQLQAIGRDGGVTTNSTTIINQAIDRDLISYGIVSRYALGSNSDETDRKRDLNIRDASSTLSAVTGSFRLEFPSRCPLLNQGQVLMLDRTASSVKENYLLDNIVGTRSGLLSSGRSFIRSTGGTSVEGTLQLSSSNPSVGYHVPKIKKFDSDSPYLLLPSDKIVLGWHHIPFTPTDIAGTPHVVGEIGLGNDRLGLPDGEFKLTLYGSLLRNNLPTEAESNQPLTSLSIHEDLHYDNPVYDQWDIESYAALTGSYVDLLITGSMFAASSDSTFGDPFATGVRQVVASVAGGEAGDRFSLSRFVRLRDPGETLLDSFPPDAGEVAAAMGFGAGTLASGEAALLAPFISPGSPDLGFSSRGFINEWYTMTAYELIQDRKRTSGRVTTLSLPVYNASDTLMGASAAPIKEVYIASDTGYVSAGRYITDGTGTRRTPDAQRNGKKALWGSGRNKNTAPSFADDHGAGYTPVIRGYKYGLAGIDGLHPSVIFRRDVFGQFRDMLEQRLYFTVYGPDNEVIRPVDIKFVPQDGVVGGTTDPQNTHSQNLSNFATSSIPYHDGLTRDRSDNPDTRLEPIDINILGNLL